MPLSLQRDEEATGPKMQYRERLTSALIAICSAGFTPSNAIAAPHQSQMGPTSRASIRIQVSVAPRVGVHWASANPADEQRLRPCFWLTDVSGKYVVTLERARTNGSTGDLENAAAAGEKIELLSRQSEADCEHDGPGNTIPTADMSEGSYLVIIAPQ
jgi:hypothetical protein